MEKNRVEVSSVIKNIFRKKIYLISIIVMVIFATLFHYIMHNYVFERFQNTMMEYVLDESKRVGQHISVHQDVSKQNEIMAIAINHILKDFNIEKIKLFDPTGVIIFSTKESEIGTKNSHDYFYNNVQKGEVYYKIVNSGELTLEDVVISKDVAEIYIPIMKNGQFVGASEIYYDISEKKYNLNNLIEQTDNMFMLVIFLLQVIVLMMIYMASKNDLLKKMGDETSKELSKIIEQQKRTSALGELMGNIAHHWRQPLSLITTAMTGLKLRYEMGIFSEDDLEKTTNLVVTHANNLSSTINRFRDFVNNANEKNRFFIDEVVESSLKKMAQNKEFQDIELKLDLSHIEIFGYKDELEEVLHNLLQNATEAFGRNMIADKHIKIDLYSNEENIFLEITDNAGGIDELIVNKIFDPYFTTKHQFQGTGLGLFFCLKIINDYFNGNITHTNTIDEKGSLFVVTIPKNKGEM